MWMYHCAAATGYVDVRKEIFSGRGAFVMPGHGVPPYHLSLVMAKYLND